MKPIFFIILVAFIALSCSKKEATIAENETYKETPYDTTAIDSFSNGAVSVDIAAQIRKSSAAYQDSLKVKAIAIEETKKAAELEKLRKEADKKKEEKVKTEVPKDETKSAQTPVIDAPKN